ncbi:hypothetical protein COSHB9_12590 [Companilactobacillus alimentarius]|nr:hypothetical protein LAL01_00560 [Companilactobacillus alimentarius]
MVLCDTINRFDISSLGIELLMGHNNISLYFLISIWWQESYRGCYRCPFLISVKNRVSRINLPTR